MIDANLNRSSEGLRVLEDVARFLLNDAELSRRLKSLRHDLSRDTRSLSLGLLSLRDSEHDVGHPQSRPISCPKSKANTGATSLRGVSDLVTANAKRVQESLRVIEELAKLPELSSMLNSANFERARFALYTLERDLTSRILRRDKTERMAGLYVILDRQFLLGRDELDIARQAIEGGATVIQLRDKSRYDRSRKGELLPIAQTLKELCKIAGYSKSTIIRSCKKVTGGTPMQRIQKLRMEEAKGLLSIAQLNVSQVADYLGYPRIHEFSREFSKYFGKPPSALLIK